MKNTDMHGRSRNEDESLIPKHGGYRTLKTFQLAEMIYDVTVLFCGKYVNARSRTHDQMVQAARSGRQNIAEGSVDSGTSKKIELKLTGVAKGSLFELRLDYEDYLRQRGLPLFEPDHAALVRFKKLRCATLLGFRNWVADETRRRECVAQPEGRSSTEDRAGCGFDSHLWPSTLAANGAISLLNLCTYLLDRQMKAQARAFEQEGGFTERLYNRRTRYRND